MNNTVILKQFATGLAAASLVSDLAAAGIVKGVTTSQEKWTNKRLPPPKIAVNVLAEDFEAGKAVLAARDAVLRGGK